MKLAVVWIVVLGVLGAGSYYGWRWYQQRAGASAPSYRTAEVKRGDVVATISATGTVVPEDVVDVGAQVNGQIASFGTDVDGKPVDYRSTVTEGSVLAKVDDTLYAADVSSNEASLAQAQASVTVAESSRDQARAKLDQTRRDWERAQKLGKSRALSQADYDASESAYEQAVASLALAEAQIGQARAQVSIAEASLQRSRRNLFYCTINSPVTGVIIDRRVDIGQTVVSSLNAPSLFLIARDLSRMQVLVQVNEADIGSVKPGAAVTFTVDAFPGEPFRGEVRKVRLNATMTQNVVTYTVEIVTDNSSLRLLPYLTANVRFIVDQREDVLTVPNAALRWAPAEPAVKASTPAAGSAAPARSGPSAGRGERGKKPPSRVWVLREGKPVAVTVRAGLTDGNVTEVSGDELAEGDEVVVGETAPATGAAAATPPSTNPFAPTMPRGGGRPGGGGR